MRRLTSRVSVTVLTLLLLAPSQVTRSPGQAVDYEEFAARVDCLLARESASDGPGVAVAVTKHGKPIYRRWFGLANLEHKVPITNETVFNLASVSKQFTALAVLILEQEGKLRLDDDVHVYFPELPDYGAAVTIRHLLHHTSGLWEYSKMFRYYGGYRQVDHTSFEDVLALLKHQQTLLFEPGSEWKYCNSNYAVLGNLVERVTGESLASWTTKHIFEPLGMKRTRVQDDCYQVIPHKAACYYKSDGSYKKDPTNSEVVGPGYLFSTLDDMELWLDNFRHHRVGGEVVIERLFQKSVLNDGSKHFYGFGLGVKERDGKTIVGHSGQTGSFKAMAMYVREDEVGIVLLANNGHVNPETLAYRILDSFYGEEPDAEVAPTAEPEPFVSMDSIDADGYGGAYLVEGGQGKLLLSPQDNGLYGIFDGLGSDFFYPLSETEFTNRLRNARFTIHTGDEGRPQRVTLDLKGEIMQADRIDPPELTREQLAASYAGTYYCEALDIAYQLAVDDTGLVIRHRRYADRPLQAAEADLFVGSLGIVRFSRSEQGVVDGFGVTDEDTHFKPLTFRKMEEI